MKILAYNLSIVCLLLIVASCSSHQQMTSVADFKSLDDPLIDALTLKSGQVVQFDDEHGWYDVANRLFEGKQVSGLRDTVAIDAVDSVAIHRSSLASSIVRGAFAGFFAIIAITVLAIAAVAIYFSFR